MANKYVFNRDHIIVNGRTFPAKYTVMTGDCMSVELLVTVDGGEMARISVPPSDRQYKAALQAAQMGLTLEAGAAAAALEDGGSASRDGSGCPAAAAAAEVQAATATAAAPDAETINNEEGATMNKSINTAAEAVKAAAAAEVQELTAAADPKATRGPVPEKTFINEVIAGNGWSIVFDAGCNRTRVIITEPVKAAARPIVEEAGFYYSKNMDSWNKKLTFRARRAALNLADKLRAALA